MFRFWAAGWLCGCCLNVIIMIIGWCPFECIIHAYTYTLIYIRSNILYTKRNSFTHFVHHVDRARKTQNIFTCSALCFALYCGAMSGVAFVKSTTLRLLARIGHHHHNKNNNTTPSTVTIPLSSLTQARTEFADFRNNANKYIHFAHIQVVLLIFLHACE